MRIGTSDQVVDEARSASRCRFDEVRDLILGFPSKRTTRPCLPASYFEHDRDEFDRVDGFKPEGKL